MSFFCILSSQTCSPDPSFFSIVFLEEFILFFFDEILEREKDIYRMSIHAELQP